MDISDFRDYTYEECRKVYKQIQHYIDDKNLLNELPSIIEKKKVEKYPELLKPTYYPKLIYWIFLIQRSLDWIRRQDGMSEII